MRSRERARILEKTAGHLNPQLDTTQADTGAAPATPSGRLTPAAWMLQAALLAATVGGAIASAGTARWDVPAFLVLMVCAVVGDVVGVSIPKTRLTLSGCLLALVVAAVLLGGLPAACVGVAVIAVGWLRWRERADVFVNNLLAFALFPLVTGWAFAAARDGLGLGWRRPEYYLLVVGAFLLALVLNFLFVAGYQASLGRTSLLTEARVALLPLLGSDALSAGLAAATVYVYWRVGISGLALVALVVVTMQYLIGELLLSRERARRLEEQAVTDELTGLGNRRRLLADLEVVLPERRPHTLVLFDLDGFKQYNDIRGHPAGDELLARLALALDRAVGDAGSAYRLGGDEFCALLPQDGGRQRVDEVVGRCATALTAEDGGLLVRASFGIVRIPAEAETASEALRIADRRMYAQKDSRPTSAQGQTRDVLLQILAEQQPDLHDHVSDVATLAVAVARRLGLDAMDLADVARTAELHDIGKLALPDALLDKAGPLTPAEWKMMERHTLIGERMLRVAPALKRVATYVRASHERWDGTGYPDGLAGEEIPLPARVIAVCDAYHAIRTDRPYREGATAEVAVAELRRCAGEQFDGSVVDALVAELEFELAAERRQGARAPIGGREAAATLDE